MEVSYCEGEEDLRFSSCRVDVTDLDVNYSERWHHRKRQYLQRNVAVCPSRQLKSTNI